MKKNYLKQLTLGLTMVLLTATNSYSQTGAALKFDGNNDYVSLGTAMNPHMKNNNKLTVEAWVKNSTLINSSCGWNLGTIIGNYNTGGGAMQFCLRRDNNRYNFIINRNNTCYGCYDGVLTGFVASTGTWQHVAGVWDGNAGTMKIYLNGILQNTTGGIFASGLYDLANPIQIASNSGCEQFTGDIDEVRIWTVARTQCEIQSYMNCEASTGMPGLLAKYSFNQGDAFANNSSTVDKLTDTGAGAGIHGTFNNMSLNGGGSNFISPGAVTSGNFTPSTPTITTGPLTVKSGSICTGNSFNIDPSIPHLGSYTVTGGSLIVSPAANTSYTVSAKIGADGCLASPSVAVSNVTVITSPLPVVTVSASSTVLCLSEKLTLTASGDATSYKWSNGGSSSVNAFYPTATASYTVFGYTNVGCYSSAVASATVNNCTAIDELNANNLFIVYPNPSNGEFFLDLNTENTTVTIFDAIGNVIYSEKLNSGKQQINLNNHAAGLYFIQAKNNDRTTSARLIKQ